MKTIYEIGDEVVITQNWRDWKVGEIAKVTNTQFEQAPNGLQLLTLRNDNEHDFHVLYEYMVAPNNAFTRQGRAKEILARKIVHVESIELGEYKLLQMTLYTNGVVEVTSIIDGKWMELEVSKSLFFQAALRLLEKDV